IEINVTMADISVKNLAADFPISAEALKSNATVRRPLSIIQ
ncbi:unnamed protein product, partial [Rotaria magnacalcarata]